MVWDALIATACAVICYPLISNEWGLQKVQRHYRRSQRRKQEGFQYAIRLLAGELDADVCKRMGLERSDVTLDSRLIYVKARLEESRFMGYRDEFDRAIEEWIEGLPSTFVEQSY
jgi:hypothetical protein